MLVLVTFRRFISTVFFFKSRPQIPFHRSNHFVYLSGIELIDLVNIVPTSNPTIQLKSCLKFPCHFHLNLKSALSSSIFLCVFMLESNEESQQALLPWDIETFQLFTSLNVMGSFFLLFDVSVDISHRTFISVKFGHTHHTNFPR